jgi:hypothetical protein
MSEKTECKKTKTRRFHTSDLTEFIAAALTNALTTSRVFRSSRLRSRQRPLFMGPSIGSVVALPFIRRHIGFVSPEQLIISCKQVSIHYVLLSLPLYGMSNQANHA